jgi:Zn-dependent peptidase ImmA (M78 family)
LNSTQSAGRQAATLMEEVCHILLGHRPTVIASWMESGRDYDRLKEEEAYGVGAAALLPYFALRESLTAGRTFRDIARRYGVSVPLVGYRAKGLKLSLRP